MVEIKSRQIASFLKQPDPATPIVLFIGPDRGLSSDRADTLAKALSKGEADTVLRLDGDSLASNPEHLAEEAHAQNLFAPVRVIRVRDGVQSLVSAVSPLLDDPPQDVFVLIESGDLKRGAPLRKLVEKSPTGVVISSYAEGPREISDLIDQMAADAGKTIDSGARALLTTLLGSDHAVSRMEIAKLIVYVGSESNITEDDVLAICGDSAATQFDALTDAVGRGASDQALVHFQRLKDGGLDESPLLATLSRHFALLHQLVLLSEGGMNRAQAIQSLRPPLHFRQKDSVEAHLRHWSRATVESALAQLHDTLLECRRDTELGPIVAARTILRLSEMARRGGRQAAR